MTTLEDLYYGNISPCERDMKRGSRMDKLVKLICKNEESLMSTFTDGFILATRIMVEVMDGMETVEDI